jgi:methionyl-tRNA synthetase
MSSKNGNRKIFVGVAWPYVNGTLHVGHFGGYLLPADICARFHRLIGDDVLMVSGSDCFGTPITVEADKKGVSPKEIVEEYHTQDVELFINQLDLSYDLYTKTDHPNHIKVTQDFFIKMLEEGYIFVDSTEQYYSETENRFLPDRYVVGKCPHCGFDDARSDQCDSCDRLLDQGELQGAKSNLTESPVILKETEHYFVNWTKLQPFLEKYVGVKGSAWKDWIQSQTKAWLDEGLRPRAITRDLDWGVPLPKDRIPKDKLIKGIENKRIYVWFDAVIGYLSGSKLWAEENGKDWAPFWYTEEGSKVCSCGEGRCTCGGTDVAENPVGAELKHYYFMGKDNLVFHCLFWPGQLHVYDETLHLPDINSINMFMDLDGKAFSKSRGVVIAIKDIVEKYGNDAVRFYFTLIMPEIRDTSFVWKDFEDKVNGILVGNLGNFIHRVLSVGKKENIESFNGRKVSGETAELIHQTFTKSKELLEDCKFRDYLDSVLALSQYGNGLVNKVELWSLKEKDSDKFYESLFELYVIILALGYLMLPITPAASGKLFEMFGSEVDLWPSMENLTAGLSSILLSATIPSKPKPLFNKIDIGV